MDGEGREKKERSRGEWERENRVDGCTGGRFLDSPLPFASLLETRTFQHQGQLPALQAHWEHSTAGSRELSGSFG